MIRALESSVRIARYRMGQDRDSVVPPASLNGVTTGRILEKSGDPGAPRAALRCHVPLGCDRARGWARWRSAPGMARRPGARVMRRTCRRARLGCHSRTRRSALCACWELERGYVSTGWGWRLAWEKVTSWPVCSSQSLRLTARRPSRIETVGTPAKMALVSWARCRL